MPVFLAVPRLSPSEMCPLSFIGDALSVADSGRTRDVMMDTFSNIVVELFFLARLVAVSTLPIKIMPETKYESYGVQFVLGTERGKPHTG